MYRDVTSGEYDDISELPTFSKIETATTLNVPLVYQQFLCRNMKDVIDLAQ